MIGCDAEKLPPLQIIFDSASRHCGFRLWTAGGSTACEVGGGHDHSSHEQIRVSLREDGLLAAHGLFGLSGCGSYNKLVTLEQKVNKQWADVQSVYQRRADLIPNLVNTVQGAANFEKSTLTEVTNARASVGQVKLDPSKAPTDAAQLQEFQQAQGQLSNALSRLLLVSENYPQLRATEAFQNLQAQLEGTENRISVERNNFNAAVQEYNTAHAAFPDEHAEQDVRLQRAAVLQCAARLGEGADGELRRVRQHAAARSGRSCAVAGCDGGQPKRHAGAVNLPSRPRG